MNELKLFLPILHRDLEAVEIDYCICGGMALWPYNCERHTQDIDIIVSAASAGKLIELTKLGYVWSPDLPRTLRFLTGGIPIMIDILIEGFEIGADRYLTPAPTQCRTRINGVWFITREALIAMKSFSCRRKDLSDVIELNDQPI